jgi:hypothetical protein
MGQLAEEVRTRIEEELDYRREAKTQWDVAAAFRAHPFIAVPGSVPELCGERVLVTEFVEGIDFEVIRLEPQEVRGRVREIVYRLYCGSLYRDGEFPGDPHPGNLLLQAGGRVAFLDFGLFKRMASASVHTELACLRAASEGRADELHRLMTQVGVFPQPELIKPAEVLAFVRDAVGWYLTDEEVEVTPELATDAFIASVDRRSPHFRKLPGSTCLPSTRSRAGSSCTHSACSVSWGRARTGIASRGNGCMASVQYPDWVVRNWRGRNESG